jgi:tetratricopeptide (TPR) repeat protein
MAADPETRVRLFISGAAAAMSAGHFEAALQLAEPGAAAATDLERSIDLGRATISIGAALLGLGRGSEVKDRLVPVYERLADDPAAVDTLAVLARLIGRSLWITAEDPAAAELWFDRCVRLSESAELWTELADCFSSYGGLMITTGRPTMGLGMLQIALSVARDHDLGAAQLNVRNNLASFLATRRPAEARGHVEEGLALARRLGERELEMWLYGTAAHVYWVSGAWEAFERISADGSDHATGATDFYGDAVALRRGVLQPQPLVVRDDADPQWRAAMIGRRGLAAWQGGETATAATLLGEASGLLQQLVEFDDDFPSYWALCLEAACDADERHFGRGWLHAVTSAPKGKLPTVVRVLIPYFRARLAAEADAVTVESDYLAASSALRDFGAPMWLGLALLRHAQWLIAQGRGDAATALLDEAEQIFGTLRAVPDLDRTRQARAFAIR